MNEQLNRAYDLIKEGQAQAAIEIIEAVIRSDRDNEDAWWLLANATSDTNAKRNALNSVLRLTSNDSRKEKANTLLQQLDDPFDFDIPATSDSVGMSEYVALDETPKKESSGRFSCATISLIVIGIIGACGLFGCFGIYTAAGGIIQSLSYPQSYDDMGVLDADTQIVGDLSAETPRDGYRYEGRAGDTINILVDYDGIASPLIVIFDADQVPVAFSQPDTSGTASISFAVPDSSFYLITVNGFEFFGQEFGFGEYTLDFENQ